MNLTGNTILITGGTSGIGLAFAEAFLKLGNTVIVCGRRQERLKSIQQKYPELITRECDVTVGKQREDLADWVIKNYPATNFFFNNAGIQLMIELTKPVDVNRVALEIETNLTAPIHFASLFALQLASKRGSAIFNISSGLAFVPIAFMPVYCATKAALHSLTISLRHQWRNTGVKVFEIIPPSVDTELGHDRREDKSQSHGGMPVHDFLVEAMEFIRNDTLEAAVGQAKGLRAKREELFPVINADD